MPKWRSLETVVLIFTSLLAPLGTSSQRALAMGMESFGNPPVEEQKEWPKGTAGLVNSPRRIYSQWVNGNERFCFLGDTEALNEALARFAKVQSPTHEVVIRPGPGVVKTFSGAAIPCDWQLEVPSGIYLGLALREEGTQVLLRHPRLTIFVEKGRIEIEKLRIPPGLAALSLEDLTARYLAGLANPDPTVRGQAAYLLGLTAPGAEAVKPLAALLKDQNQYPRSCAAGALGSLGRDAAAALPALKEALAAARENERQSIEKSIEEIEGRGAEPESPRQVNEKILQFLRTLSPGR